MTDDPRTAQYEAERAALAEAIHRPRATAYPDLSSPAAPCSPGATAPAQRPATAATPSRSALDCLGEGKGREAELWPAGHVHGGPELLPWQPPGLPYDQVT